MQQKQAAAASVDSEMKAAEKEHTPPEGTPQIAAKRQRPLSHQPDPSRQGLQPFRLNRHAGAKPEGAAEAVDEPPGPISAMRTS
eukprot:4478315-Alexandrium_andersonii.AAC.1